MNVFILGVARQGSHQLLASSYMEKELKLLGILPTVLPVGDEAQLKAAIQKIMLMGGLILSPLTGNAAIDRLLSDQMAKACGVPLEMNESVFEQIAQRNVKLTREEVAQLATLPRGAEVYALQDNTYPAYQLDGENIHAILLPPDPVEQSAVFLNTVFPTFAQQKKYACESHILRVMDLSLSEVETALKDGLTSENPCIAVYPGKEEVIVRVSVRAQDPQQAASACQSAAKTVLEHLNGYVYGVDVPNIERALMQRLEKQGLHLSLFESGTNRRAEKRLVKCKKAVSVELNFPQDAMSNPAVADIIKKYGAVSNQTAAAMAAAVSDSKHIGVGISLPTSREKAASAHVAASFSGHTLSKEIPISGFKSVQQLTDACVSHALNLARKFADSHPALPKGAAAATVAMAAAAGKKEDTTSMKNKAEGTPSLLKRFATAFFPQKADSTGEKMRKLGIILCLCVFCCSVGYLMNHHQQGVNAVETNKELSNMKEDFKNGKLDGYEIDEEKLAAVAPEVLDEYKPFVAINNDMQGWVEIEGTNLSYPVVQAKDNDYYHRRNFQGEDDYYGIPYLDYECRLDTDPERCSDNLIIYGHNIGNDGLMFNPLSYYKQLDFYKQHPVVRFDSIYKEQEYKIFGVMIVNSEPEQDNGTVFKYWQQVDFDDEEEFNAFVNEVRRRSMWDIDVDVQPDDNLLTLSTCCYDFRPNARCVILARAIREGEDRTVDTSTAKVNEDAYYPKAYYDALNEKAKYGHVKGIKIDGKAEQILEVGQTLQLKAITDPADAPINTATWDSSTPTIATVDAKTGLVTAVAPGETKITAMADDGGYAASVTIVVKAKNALEYLYFEEDEITLTEGQEAALTVYADPEDAAVDLTWSIGGDALTGSANKSNQKQFYVKAVAATNEPVAVTVTDKTTKVSATCYIYVIGANGGGTQSGPLAATANPVTVPAGTTTAQIVVSSNNVSILEDLEVYIDGDVEAEIDYRNSYINDDGTLVIVLIIPEGSAGSSNVTFEYDGKKVGSTTVTVQGESSGNQSGTTPPAQVQVTNQNDTTGTVLNNGALDLTLDTENFTQLLVNGQVSKDYTWTSDNEDIAYINKSGKLMTESTGTVTITVKDKNGNVVSTFKVNVKDPEAEEQPPVQEVKKCSECGVEDGKPHASSCSKYTCATCGQPIDGTHQEGCEHYVEPEVVVCNNCGGEDGEHFEVCSACGQCGGFHNSECSTLNQPATDDCTCTPVDGAHQEGCPLAVAATSLDDELSEETTPSEETPSDPTETPTEV